MFVVTISTGTPNAHGGGGSGADGVVVEVGVRVMSISEGVKLLG